MAFCCPSLLQQQGSVSPSPSFLGGAHLKHNFNLRKRKNTVPDTWTHGVPEGVRSNGVLGGQRAAAEDDEDQDEVGEDVMVDQSVTGHTDPGDRQTDRQTGSFGFL